MDELAEYIIDYHGSYLTEVEKAAVREVHFRAKRDSSRRSENSGVAKIIEDRLMSTDPAVIALAEQGLESLYLQIRDRVLHDHEDQLDLNRCPKCDGLCRTPRAKQCRHCFHKWH